MFERDPKDVFVIEPSILHRLNQFPGLIGWHSSIRFKYALKGTTHIRCHGDVPTHVEMTPLLYELVNYSISILLQQVLNVFLQRTKNTKMVLLLQWNLCGRLCLGGSCIINIMKCACREWCRREGKDRPRSLPKRMPEVQSQKLMAATPPPPPWGCRFFHTSASAV